MIGHPGDKEIFIALDAATREARQEAFQVYQGRLVAVQDILAHRWSSKFKVKVKTKV